MAKRYRYTFMKAGSYERKDGSMISVHTSGASIIAGYREFAASKDVLVKPISTNLSKES